MVFHKMFIFVAHLNNKIFLNYVWLLEYNFVYTGKFVGNFFDSFIRNSIKEIFKSAIVLQQ